MAEEGEFLSGTDVKTALVVIHEVGLRTLTMSTSGVARASKAASTSARRGRSKSRPRSFAATRRRRKEP